MLISDGVSSNLKVKWSFLILCNIILLSFHASIVNSFNLDSKFPLFIKNPSRQQKLYFGYAVDYYVDSSESWVVVGAPKSGFNGEVYRCQKNTSDATLNYGPCENVQISIKNSPHVRQMLGSTLLVGKRKQLLGCAPTYSHTTTSSTGVDSYYLIGACYMVEDFTDQSTTTFEYLPCSSSLGNGNGHKLSFCQAGFSATFLKENEKVLLGAVGSYYNQGSILLLNETNANYLNPSIVTNEIIPTIPDDWPGSKVDYYRQSYDNNYMGYSVAGGKSVDGRTIIATSAPRRLGFDLLGAVIIYDEELKNVLVNFTGEQIGEYFGHGLAFVDVNGDNLDDLIVGSPLYTDDAYRKPEVGRIYIYYQQDPADSEADILFSDPIIINGNASMGRFGNTITSMGDVNSDNYQDFLVSAPYEGSETVDNRYGALYVFNGRGEGVSKNPSQVIHGAALDALTSAGSSIRGLGFSIKGGKDMDNNGYPDIVAGAYLSDHAVMIRARPVVKLVVKNTLHPTKIDLDTPDCTLDVAPNVKTVCFTVHSCFSYDGKSLPPSVAFFYSYDADSTQKEDDKRAYVTDSSARRMTLTAGSTALCVDEKIYLKNEIKDKLTPISVTLSYWLDERDEPVEPVLDIYTGTSSTIVAEIGKNCGSDNICTPELEVISQVVKPSEVLIGKYAEILISSTVVNHKERAYQTLLVVQYPTSVSYINIVEEEGPPIHCVNVNSTVVCAVGNPLVENQKVEVNLRFGTRDLKGDVPRLTFDIFANCSNEQSYVSRVVQNYVDVGVQANIQIFNASLPEIVPLDKLANEVNVSGAFSVSHTYEITNAGPSSFASAKIQVLWPLSLESGDLLFGLDEVITVGGVRCSAVHVVNETKTLDDSLAQSPPPQSKYDKEEAYRTVNYYNCQSQTKHCSEIICTVDGMQPKEDILITFKGRLRVGPLLAGVTDSIITSSLVFEILTYPYEISAGMKGTLTTSEVSTSALYPQAAPPASVDWWVIAIAVAGGVLFLLVIIFILWKCGFFKRKRIPTEEDLDQQQQLYQAELVEKEQDVLH